MKKNITVYVHRSNEEKKDCTIRRYLSADTNGHKIWPAGVTGAFRHQTNPLSLRVKISPSCVGYSKRDICDLAESYLPGREK